MAGLCLENDIVVDTVTGDFLGFLVSGPGIKTVTAENTSIIIDTDYVKVPTPGGNALYPILSVSGADPNVLIGTNKMILNGNIVSWYDGERNKSGRAVGTSAVTVG